VEVRRGDVDQTLHDTGTVQPVDQAAVSFPVAGTVATVDVAEGATVTPGQKLATLDPAQLEQGIDTAQAELDQARLALSQARSGQLGSPSSNGGDGRASEVAFDAGSGDQRAVLASATQEVDGEVADAQDAVLEGQRAVDSRLGDAQDALDTADRICAAMDEPSPAASTTTTAPGGSTTTTPSSTPTTSTTADGSGAVDACRAALSDVLTAQEAVRDAQRSLADAAERLDELLAQRAQDPPDASGGDGSTDGGADSVHGSDGASSSVSAADLISHQKAVDAAEAELVVAQQALKQATIVSPIEGTVVAVDLAVGDAVEAASATARIVVVGPGGYEVVATIGVDDLPEVDLGQAAVVRPDGSDRQLAGRVVAIGLAATGDTGATTYPVTISVEDDGGLRNGSVAAVSIVTATASGALAVPTSAVRAEGGRYTVLVLADGEPKPVQVQVGAIGPTWTEVTSGLRRGQRVVLADLDEPLPSSATSSSNGPSNGSKEVRVPAGGGPPLVFKTG
jgi:HlyD family secretion protein